MQTTSNWLRLGTELIDTRDGRTCVVGSIRGDGTITLRKRSLVSGKWTTLRWEPGRFQRAGRRQYRLSPEGLEKKQRSRSALKGTPRLEQQTEKLRQTLREKALAMYGPEVVRLAEGLGLTYGQVWAIRGGA